MHLVQSGVPWAENFVQNGIVDPLYIHVFRTKISYLVYIILNFSTLDFLVYVWVMTKDNRRGISKIYSFIHAIFFPTKSKLSSLFTQKYFDLDSVVLLKSLNSTFFSMDIIMLQNMLHRNSNFPLFRI